MTNTSVAVSSEDVDRVRNFLLKFKERTGFEISVSQFVKKAINEKLANEELK